MIRIMNTIRIKPITKFVPAALVTLAAGCTDHEAVAKHEKTISASASVYWSASESQFVKQASNPFSYLTDKSLTSSTKHKPQAIICCHREAPGKVRTSPMPVIIYMK